MPPKRYSQPKKSQVDLEITTAQKVMLGVALLASIGAFAAGFAAIPNANCNKGDKNCFTKTGLVTTSIKTGQVTTSIKTSQTTTQPKLPTSSVTMNAEKVLAGSLVVAEENVAGGVYYKGVDGKFAKFENLEAFKTWLSSVKYNTTFIKVPQKQINHFLSGQRILLRPGSKLLKVESDNAVLYVCEKDSICRVGDAVTATGLMGNNWNNNVLSITKTEEGLYKKVKTLSNGDDINIYKQKYLLNKYPSIDKYLGL